MRLAVVAAALVLVVRVGVRAGIVITRAVMHATVEQGVQEEEEDVEALMVLMVVEGRVGGHRRKDSEGARTQEEG